MDPEVNNEAPVQQPVEAWPPAQSSEVGMPASPSPQNSRLWLWITLGVVGVALIGLGGWFGYKKISGTNVADRAETSTNASGKESLYDSAWKDSVMKNLKKVEIYRIDAGKSETGQLLGTEIDIYGGDTVANRVVLRRSGLDLKAVQDKSLTRNNSEMLSYDTALTESESIPVLSKGIEVGSFSYSQQAENLFSLNVMESSIYKQVKSSPIKLRDEYKKELGKAEGQVSVVDVSDNSFCVFSIDTDIMLSAKGYCHTILAYGKSDIEIFHNVSKFYFTFDDKKDIDIASLQDDIIEVYKKIDSSTKDVSNG